MVSILIDENTNLFVSHANLMASSNYKFAIRAISISHKYQALFEYVLCGFLKANSKIKNVFNRSTQYFRENINYTQINTVIS